MTVVISPRFREKAADALLDRRLPHWMPLSAAKTVYYNYRLGDGILPLQSLDIALTFDVEQDYGSLGERGRTETCRPFLQWFHSLAETHGWRTTLFVQGELVIPLADELAKLALRHELGLHGYYHELWGTPKWYMHDRAATIAERERGLEQGILAFGEAGLPRPRSFRAPNLIIDHTSLKLLEKCHFRVDSSAAAFAGVPPVPRAIGQIVSVPVTVSLEPRYVWRGIIPTYAPYRVLNLKNFLEMPEPFFIRYISRVASYQLSRGVQPFLNIFAHPWEFYENTVDRFCSEANCDRLVRRVEMLERLFPVKHLSISELAEKWAGPRMLTK